MTLVLASASPRRRELLAELGVPFTVVPSDVPETPEVGETAEAFALRAAREKAAEVAAPRPAQWVLAADTVVVRNGEILGKPADPADARRMLRSLSGRVHRVLTAIVLVAPGGAEAEAALVESTVTFRDLSEPEIDAYLETGEPFDKAGAYAIQGLAAPFVIRVEGSYTNVVGLPLDEVRGLLQHHGLLARVVQAAL